MRNPLAPILECGRRQVRVGLALGIAGSFIVHGAGAATGMRKLVALEAYAKGARSMILDQLFSEYDVEIEKPKPPPEPEPQAEEEGETEQQETEKPPPKANQAPPQEPPPEAAQAGKVLTAEADPDAPLDLTGEGFVVGNADHYSGGVTAAKGTSKTAVRDQRARGDGVKGGKGSGKRKTVAAKPPEPEKDLSRAAKPSSTNWNCGFPPEADVAQINFARVRVVVTVGPDGRAKAVAVQNDPGHGFGEWARRCAMRNRYAVGLDRWGKPATRTTPPFWVTFTR
jgi:protein TonB